MVRIGAMLLDELVELWWMVDLVILVIVVGLINGIILRLEIMVDLYFIQYMFHFLIKLFFLILYFIIIVFLFHFYPKILY